MLNVTDEAVMAVPTYVGYIALLINIIFWGTFYLPVKKFDTGDGLFFQLFMCLGVWTVAYVINWIRNFPTFYALPMLCGFFWSAGNLTSVPIIKTIGLSIGQPVWDATALIVGWIFARFGLLGSKPQLPSIAWMNYLGTAIATTSSLFFLFVKSEVTSSSKVEPEGESTTQKNEDSSFIDRLNPTVKRIVGFSCAIFSGIMYGLNYAPILYIKDNYEGASENELDYIFSFCSGTLVASIAYMLVYSAFKRNNPIVFPKVILPAFVSGCMWCIANACFLIASTSLSQTIVVPIGMSTPPMVAALCGIIIFKEIKGVRNLMLVGVAFSFSIVGSILSGLSQ